MDYSAVNRLSGMTQYFQGYGKLAEMFIPDDTLEEVTQGDDANKWPEVILCHLCFMKVRSLADLLFSEDESDI